MSVCNKAMWLFHGGTSLLFKELRSRFQDCHVTPYVAVTGHANFLRAIIIYCIITAEKNNRLVGSLNRDMCNAFRVHFSDRFARCSDFPVQEFRSCLAAPEGESGLL